MRRFRDFCSHKFVFSREIALAIDDDDDNIYSCAPCRHAPRAHRRGSDIMRVTIIKRPHCTIHEMHFTGWRVGETYDVSFEIASLLIVEGCAQLEMRAGRDRRRAKRREATERRSQRIGG